MPDIEVLKGFMKIERNFEVFSVTFKAMGHEINKNRKAIKGLAIAILLIEGCIWLDRKEISRLAVRVSALENAQKEENKE